MGCLSSLVALPFKLAGTAALGVGVLLIASGFKVRHAGFCALGAVLSLAGGFLGYLPFWAGLIAAGVGGYGFRKFQRRLPP